MRIESEWRPIPDEIRHEFNIESEIAEVTEGGGEKGWKHFTPEFVDTKSSELDIQASIRAMDARQKTYKERKISQEKARVNIETDTPVTVFFIGDVHLGKSFCDHRGFMKDMKEIIRVPNTGVVFMHNLVDNAIPAQYPDSLLETSIPPEEQFPLMQGIIKKMDEEGKVLAAVQDDCHEGWSWKKAGVDASALLYGYEGRQFPVLENGGRLELKIGKKLYQLGLYHKAGPFESHFNPSHAMRQMNRLQQQMECDVIVGAHRHRANVEKTIEGSRPSNQKEVVYIRTGTYLGTKKGLHDRFLVDRYGRTGEPPGQSVMFHPDKKLMEVALEFDEGMGRHENALVLKALDEMGVGDKIRERVSPKRK